MALLSLATLQLVKILLANKVLYKGEYYEGFGKKRIKVDTNIN